jgi:hypothetical protein
MVSDQEKVKAFGFCPDHTCVGYQQEPVDGLRTVRSDTFRDSGGDANMPGEYRSFEFVTFANQKDRECRFCGRDRQIALQQRPEYAPVTSAGKIGESNDNQMAALVAKQADELAAMREQIAKMQAGK